MIYVYHKKMNKVWYCAAVHDTKIVATYFSVKEPDLNRLLRKLPQEVRFQVLDEPNEPLTEVMAALEEIFKGKDKEDYDLKMAFDRLSSYARKVLNCTRLVPVGYVTTYSAIAKVAGRIARSVGRVEASNLFPLLIPCHRVVCSDLTIGGYGYGEQVKMEILQREDRGYEESRTLQVDGGLLSVFPANRVKQRVS